jgi:RNA polymerase sigma factor (sigma-70 family)
LTVLTDVELLDQARRGDRAAFAELYGRHRAVARRVALAVCRRGDPDDLVSEAFEKVFAAVRRNRGPTEAFRAYLFVTLRRLAARQRAHARDEPVDEVPEPVMAEQSGDLDPSERHLITKAFEALPDRWQTVLWHTTVEGRHPREVGRAVGMSSNAVSALAYRARERLRQEYLQAHLQTAPRPECEPHRSSLAAYVRNGLGRRDRTRTRHHLEGCTACHALVAELQDINGALVRSVTPLFFATDLAELVGGMGPAAAAEAADLAQVAPLEPVVPGRRSKWLWARPEGLTSAAGGVAAAITLLIALGAGGALVLGDDSESTSTAPAVTTAGGEPGGSTAAAAVACESGQSRAPTTTGPPSAGDGSGLRIADVGCETATQGEGSLRVTVAGDEPDPVPPDERSVSVSTPDLVPDVLPGVVPDVDASLAIELDDGARVAVDTNLPEMCQVNEDRRDVVCRLDDALGNAATETLAKTGVELELEGAGGTLARLELRDGDAVLDAKLVNVLP